MVYSGIFYPSWTLLSLEARVSRVTRRLRCFDSAGLLFNSANTNLFRQETRCTLQLDFPVVWCLHHFLWHNPHYGNLDAVAS